MKPPSKGAGAAFRRWALALGSVVAIAAAFSCSREPPRSAEAPSSNTPLADQVADATKAKVTEGAEQAAADEAEDRAFALDDRIFRQHWSGDLDGMVKRRFLRVLVVSSKTLYFMDRGTQRGATYDTFKFLEDELNRKLATKHVRFHVAFIPVSRDELLPKLAEGLGDVAAANLTITSGRQELVDFTKPVLRGIDEIVVTDPTSPKIAHLDDLAGREVFVRKSSSYYESLVQLNRDLASRGKPEAIIKPAPEELEDEDLLEMLNAGLVKVCVVDSHIARFWTKIFPHIRLHEDVTLRRGGEIAWAIRKGSPKLKAELEALIDAHGQGKAFGNEILRRYLKSTKYVKNAATEAELRKFRQVVEVFRKYGGRYEIDPLLMAAQGYQESRLDQHVRSRVGAIGVMQVMPATGKELGVGDIRQVDPNVHAGIKYIRFMIDQYYKDEPMSPLNKGLFAFASYNAGPARIQQMRKKAGARGIDPNVWFNSVELVTAEEVGREPVQYVSNIYKYYVAYRLLEETRAAKEAAKRSASEMAEGPTGNRSPPGR